MVVSFYPSLVETYNNLFSQATAIQTGMNAEILPTVLRGLSSLFWTRLSLISDCEGNLRCGHNNCDWVSLVEILQSFCANFQFTDIAFLHRDLVRTLLQNIHSPVQPLFTNEAHPIPLNVETHDCCFDPNSAAPTYAPTYVSHFVFCSVLFCFCLSPAYLTILLLQEYGEGEVASSEIFPSVFAVCYKSPAVSIIIRSQRKRTIY